MYVLSHDPNEKESAFYYIPLHGGRIAQSQYFLDPLERTLTIFYMPLEHIDYRITGAERRGIPMLGLSGGNPDVITPEILPLAIDE